MCFFFSPSWFDVEYEILCVYIDTDILFLFFFSLIAGGTRLSFCERLVQNNNDDLMMQTHAHDATRTRDER